MRTMRRNMGVILLGAALLAASPVAAQIYSDGFQFLEAVKKKDGDKVAKLLADAGAAATLVNSRDLTSGETALHIAIGRRDMTWVTFLIGRGADPNIPDKRGVTPLMLACQLGIVEGVEALAKAGARVDVANNTGETPLIAAVHRRDVALLRVLLKAGANPDRTDNSGRSARDYAALDGPNSTMLGEIERNAKAGAGAKPTYGPSF